MVINQWNITLLFQQKTNNLNAGSSSRLHKWETGREGGREALSCIVLLTLWYIILSCLGRCSKRSSHNILLNRSIVHAIRMHISEFQVSAHTMCAVPECRQCSLCASNGTEDALK